MLTFEVLTRGSGFRLSGFQGLGFGVWGSGLSGCLSRQDLEGLRDFEALQGLM